MKSQSKDLYWVLSLYGTAIGAGVLFLPIAIGILGLIPAFIILILIFPMIFFPHRSLCRFVMSGKEKGSDITVVANSYFGEKKGFVFNLLYLFCILPILFIYSVGIVNTLLDFLKYQLHYDMSDYRLWVCLGIISVLIASVSMGRNFIVKLMSIIVIPFVLVLFVISIWMIQFWDMSIISNSLHHNMSVKGVLLAIFLAFPIVVFSFNHSPIISSLAVYAKNKYGDDADTKASKIIAMSNILMIFTVVIFVLSTMCTLSPAELQEAKQQNISILSYLANNTDNAFLMYATPIVALVAMAKSFFGHYLGAKEGIVGLLSRAKPNANSQVLSKITLILVFLSCFAIAYLNPNILDMISNIIGPFLIVLLFFIPIYSIYKFKELSQYKNKFIDTFIILLGVFTIVIVSYQLI